MIPIDPGFAAFVTFTFVLVITPGSTTAVVVRNTLEGGRRAGYWTALGAALANATIAFACGIGLSVLVAVWPGSLDAIHYAGAGFLAWLGVRSLYKSFVLPDGGINLSLTADHNVERSHWRAYLGDGLAINLLSPVIISFYLSVVPTFIPAGASRGYYVLLAATHVSLALGCHSMWATMLDLMRRWFVAPWTRRGLQAATGLALVALSIRVVGQSTPLHAQEPVRVPVLAELFTSEGCDSCPPADRLLETLLDEQPIPGVLVVPLSEHVTYWDHQGWRDPFDSQQFTARQQQYGFRFNLDSIYTPQLIVDGSREMIGSDRKTVERALQQAASVTKALLDLTVDASAPDRLVASAVVRGELREPGAELWFALTEHHLSVDVKAGENQNRTLRHSGVVRVLQSAGSLDASSRRVSLAIQPTWNRQNLAVVAFVQSKKDRRVLAVGTHSLAP